MDLLQDNKKKNEKTPAQKVVLALLIITIILCIIIGIIMAYLSVKGKNIPFSITLNGKNINLDSLQLMTTESGQKYVSLKSISNYLEYDYYNGEFKITDETKSKGYIDNKTNIIQFLANSREIYKTIENSYVDYEYYNLENPILLSQELLYISLDDLDIALNLIVTYSEQNNQTIIQSPQYWIEQKTETYAKSNITISNTPENLKALSYGYIVISKQGKYGVISLTGEELIGNKYNSISFCEYTKKFIVSNTSNEYGIITPSGIANISLQYDSIEILNYKPLLYKIKRLNKYGIMKQDGTILDDIQYDSIGYPENKSKKTNYTLIIPNLNENIPESIVVYKDNRYGLINLEDGKQIIPCVLSGIYSFTKDNKLYYIVETQDNKLFLENYIDNLNRVTAIID